MEKWLRILIPTVLAGSFALWSCHTHTGSVNSAAAKNEVKVTNKETERYPFCLSTQPVDKASDIHRPQNIEDNFLSDSDFNKMLGGIAHKTKIKIDSTVIYTTHKDFQREIIVSKACINDKAFGENLMKELFVSDFIYDQISLIKSENKNIINFGDALIYEYEIIGGSEYNPHHITLVLKEEGANYVGISICSDGMRWEKVAEGAYLPLFVERVRIHKQYEIPMLYMKNKFIPLGYHKIPELWKED
ncbi:hypothetical protein TPENAI_61195 [Tenacibaculum litopenaei]|uniref:hypothetical protein n=1 Tax=Tenacibaculum litopenaei TaxID=396016 RepID=UPI003895F0E7